MSYHTEIKEPERTGGLAVAPCSADGFLQLLAGVVEAERLVVAGLKPEMPCRKMHENRHRAFREALSMATAYFKPNEKDVARAGMACPQSTLT